MVSQRNAIKDGVVETKRPRKTLPSLSADQVREAIGPIIDQLPSHKAAPPELKTIDDYILVINVEWREAQDRFLKIGELLDRAERTLPQTDYMTLCDRLPFGKSTRSQLLSAFRCVQSGRIPADMVSAGYSTLYQVSQLSDDEIKQASESGLLRADVKRNELLEFRRRLRSSIAKTPSPQTGDKDAGSPVVAKSEGDIVRLKARRETLLKELAEIERLLLAAGVPV
jgi:hypothetical protein